MAVQPSLRVRDDGHNDDAQVERESLHLVYFTPADLQVPRVDRQCILRFCDALALAGSRVEVTSLKIRLSHDEPSAHMPLDEVYGLRAHFPIHLLRSGLSQTSRKEATAVTRLVWYSVHAARYLFRSADEDVTLFYFKNAALVMPFAVLRTLTRGRVRLVFEAHGLPATPFRRSLIGRADLVISNHPALTADLTQAASHPFKRIATLHQGVDIDALETQRVTREEARRQLGLPLEEHLVVYTGKVFVGWREVELLLEAAVDFPPGTRLVIVGGREDHVAEIRSALEASGVSNVTLTGFIEPSRVYLYQLAADILLSYYTYDKPLLEYVSPGKLFEYMASRRPIICADHPALRDVLSDAEARFVPPEDPPKLADAVESLLADPAHREELADNAYELAGKYTWASRAAQFLALADEIAPQKKRSAG